MSTPETLFESKWLGLYRIDGWDFTRRPSAEACVGILAITDAEELILVEQFRIPVQRRVIEIPAGLVGDEDEHRGEPIEETARRELLPRHPVYRVEFRADGGRPGPDRAVRGRVDLPGEARSLGGRLWDGVVRVFVRESGF